MDGYASEIDPWMQVCLSGESMFCAAPSPSGPDDIICPGSDDGTDEATRVAKRLRYEEHGRRYLQGIPPHILSASLRGPFDTASGWQNPWLPKPSSYLGQRLGSSSQPPVASSAIRHRGEIPVGRQSSGQDDTTQDLYDSMQCHLPSPQSHQELQFLDSPTHSEKRSRIQSWANNIHGDVLEKDSFWAPNHSNATRNIESAPKRPAGRDWLKRRSAKKRKPDAYQSTEAIHTPTPIPLAPPRAKKTKEPVTQKSASRSFEMATPSSSPEQAPRESLHCVKPQLTGPDEEDGCSVALNMSAGGNQSRTGPPGQSRGEEAEERKDGDEEEAENARASEHMCQDQSMEQTSRLGEEPEEAIDFHECSDESFIYQTRQLHQATRPETSNETIIKFPSQCTQTKKLISPKDDGAVNVLSDPDARGSNWNATRDHVNASSNEHMERLHEPSVASAMNNGSDHSSITAVEQDNPLRSQEAMLPTCGITDENADASRHLGPKTDQSLREITPNSRLINIHNNIPQTMLKVNESQVASTEPFLDEGPTLLGDPLDVEDVGYLEPALRDPGTSFFESSLLQRYAISATNMAIVSQVSLGCDVTTPNEANYTTSSPTATIPQQGLTDSQLTTSKPRSQSSQHDRTDLAISADATVNENDEDILQITALGQAIPAEQQSPWTPKPIVNSTQYSTKNIEGVEDTPEQSHVQPAATLPDPSELMHYSPTIRPSQQSPWIREVSEPTIRTRLEEISSMSATIVMDMKSPEKQSPFLRVDQGDLCWSASPIISPVSGSEHQSLESKTVVEEPAIPSVPDFPYTPITKIVRQSTPDGEVSIRSFSNFQFPSPQQSAPPTGSSISRSILKVRKFANKGTSTKSSRRVLFAPLPHEEESSNDQPSTKLRAASPPPSAVVDIEEENVNGRYRNHFDIMNRRLGLNAVTSPRYHQRLLPSSSQQKPESPSVGAMAVAFREADAQRVDYEEIVVEDIQTDGGEAGVEEIEERFQSPWQQDSEGIDDVAAVMGNLPDFLDVWDVETEMDKQRTELELNEMGKHGVLSNTDMSILQGVGIW
ncbi:hypothetical protein F5B18DRAFT_610879 [Nemania serpens]|nr:hypothetical protein F5B18DRAFT_610879 [Nemania serpens]